MFVRQRCAECMCSVFLLLCLCIIIVVYVILCVNSGIKGLKLVLISVLFPDAFAKLRKATVNYVYLSACNSLAPTGRIILEFEI
jgi:hypothetical protein